MSLPSKDWQILEHILQYRHKIDRTVERFGDSFQVFADDPDYADSVGMNLLQIGELAGRFSENFVVRSKELGINWRAIKNMWNMFAHDYGAMDMERVWVTVMEDVPELEAFCEAQLKDEPF